MRRGDIYRVIRPRKDDPKRSLLYVVVSRQDLLDSGYSTAVCAHIYTKGHGLETEVPVGIEEGIKHTSWITCDNLRSISKSELTNFVGSLSYAKMEEVNVALSIALDID